MFDLEWRIWCARFLRACAFEGGKRAVLVSVWVGNARFDLEGLLRLCAFRVWDLGVACFFFFFSWLSVVVVMDNFNSIETPL